MYGNQPFRRDFAAALREARACIQSGQRQPQALAFRRALLAAVLGGNEAGEVVRSTTTSAIEITLGLVHPGWSVTVSHNRTLLFRNDGTLSFKDITGRILLYTALAELRGRLANAELYGLVLSTIVDNAVGASATNWSPYRAALEVYTLSAVLARRSADSSQLVSRLTSFELRPRVFLSDLIGLASEQPHGDSTTIRSPKIRALVDSMIPLILEPQSASEPQLIEISQDGECLPKPASGRVRAVAAVLAEEVLAHSVLDSRRRIMYRCWYEVAKACGSDRDLADLKQIKKIAKALPGDFDSWRLPERYLELDASPSRLLALLTFVTKFVSESNFSKIQEKTTTELESFITSPLGFSADDAILGVRAILSFAHLARGLSAHNWAIPELRARICTLGAVLRVLGWDLNGYASRAQDKFAFASHAAEVLYGRPLTNMAFLGELLDREPQLLEHARVLWREPEDFAQRWSSPADIVTQFRYRVVFAKLAERFFKSSAPDWRHEFREMQALYRRLGREVDELFVGVRSLADLDSAKVDDHVRQAERALRLHLLSGIVQGRLSAAEDVLSYFLENHLKIDAPPYRAENLASPDSEYVKCVQDVAAVQFAALERYFGQDALKFSFQRAVPGAPMLFENFLRACARNVLVIEGRGKAFPGSGAIFSKLRLSAVFDKESKVSLDLIYPFASEVTADIEETTYAYMRGLRLVIPPANVRYRIGGKDYALLSFQDHFGDPDSNGVCLIEVGAARRLVSYIKQADQFPSSTELLQRLRRETNDILYLTELANLGGFSHAFEPRSMPFLYHMPSASGLILTSDYLGHVHASMISGKYVDHVSPAVEEAWRPLREAHAEVRDVAKRLLALESMVRIVYSRYAMGFDYSTARGEDIFPHPELLVPGEVVVPIFAERTLEFGLQYAMSLRTAGVKDKNRYPVLVIANPVDHWSKPEDSSYLDLYDSWASGDFGEHRFSSAGPLTDSDITVWREHFWKPANANGFEIRLEDRRRVFV